MEESVHATGGRPFINRVTDAYPRQSRCDPTHATVMGRDGGMKEVLIPCLGIPTRYSQRFTSPYGLFHHPIAILNPLRVVMAREVKLS